jgi:MFS family permease
MSGVIGTQAYKRYFHHPTSYVQGLITASMPAGSLAGSLLCSLSGDRYSRKLALRVSCVLWIVGSAVQCAAVNVPMLCVGRAVSGIGVGVASSVVPVYQVSCGGHGKSCGSRGLVLTIGRQRLHQRRSVGESSGQSPA